MYFYVKTDNKISFVRTIIFYNIHRYLSIFGSKYEKRSKSIIFLKKKKGNYNVQDQ